MNPQIAEILSYIRKAGGLNADYKGNPQGNFYERALATLHGVEGEIARHEAPVSEPAMMTPRMSREDVALMRQECGMEPATFNYSDPVPEMLSDPIWDAIWNEIKTWDVNVPTEYAGYCGATGNHVTAIYRAIIAARSNPPAQTDQPRGYTRASDEGGFAERPYPPAQKEQP